MRILPGRFEAYIRLNYASEIVVEVRLGVASGIIVCEEFCIYLPTVKKIASLAWARETSMGVLGWGTIFSLFVPCTRIIKNPQRIGCNEDTDLCGDLYLRLGPDPAFRLCACLQRTPLSGITRRSSERGCSSGRRTSPPENRSGQWPKQHGV